MLEIHQEQRTKNSPTCPPHMSTEPIFYIVCGSTLSQEYLLRQLESALPRAYSPGQLVFHPDLGLESYAEEVSQEAMETAATRLTAITQ